MQVVKAFPGARGFDSLGFSQVGKADQANEMAKDFEFYVGYLGAMNAARLGYILDAGMGFMPVTFGGGYKKPAVSLIQMNALSMPAGVTVWADMEGLDVWNTPWAQVASEVEAWAAAMNGAGYEAGLYVGAPQPGTGKQLYSLKGITKYWLGQGRCIGKDGLDAYPDCGWCMRQDWHNNPNAAQGVKGGMLWKQTGVLIDTNSIQADHKGRLPNWVIR